MEFKSTNDTFGTMVSMKIGPSLSDKKQLKKIYKEPKDKTSVLWQEWKILQEEKNNG